MVASSGETDAVLAVGQLGYWSARFPQFEDLVQAELNGAAAMARAARDAGKPLVVSTVYPDSAPAATLRAEGVPVYREIASAAAALAALAGAGGRPGGVPDLPRPSTPVTTSCGYLEARALLREAGLPFPGAPPGRHMRGGRSRCAPSASPSSSRRSVCCTSRMPGESRWTCATRARSLRWSPPWRSACSRPASWSSRWRPPAAWSSSPAAAANAAGGPLALVGAGGLYAEVFGDTCTALAPVDEAAAAGLIGRLRVAELLHGARGAPRLDVPRPRRRRRA